MYGLNVAESVGLKQSFANASMRRLPSLETAMEG